MLLFSLTAIPFWVMVTTTAGFFGSYSRAIGTAESGIPFMQPFSIRRVQSMLEYLPALNFAAILEDKGERDLTSRLRFNGTAWTLETEMGRDYFLISVTSRSLDFAFEGIGSPTLADSVPPHLHGACQLLKASDSCAMYNGGQC